MVGLRMLVQPRTTLAPFSISLPQAEVEVLLRATSIESNAAGTRIIASRIH